MAIQSSVKFLAEFSVKIGRLRRKLMTANAVMPTDEIEIVLDQIRALEFESAAYESLIDGSPSVSRNLDRLLEVTA